MDLTMFPPSDFELLTYAIDFATRHHGSQVDRAGGPFIGHPLRVLAYYVQDNWTTVAGATAAVLHDVVEDTDVDLDVVGGVFGTEVRELVDYLTRDPLHTYTRYVRRLADGPHEAIRVKLADLRDNMDTRRVPPEHQGWHRGLVRSRYEPTRELLEEVLNR